MSYCPLFKICFPDFSLLCFHISEWKLVASFYIKTSRSSSKFVTVDLPFHELLSFVQNLFSGLFFAMLSHIWMKVGSKLLYKDFQIKFQVRYGWPTFSWVIAVCSKFVFRTFPHYAITYLNESWKQAYIWRILDQVPSSLRLTIISWVIALW